MAAHINFAALAALRLRSDSLGPVDSIAHPLEPGRYHGTAFLRDAVCGTFDIEISDQGSGNQVDIDLSTLTDKAARVAFVAGPQSGSPVFAVFHSSGERTGFRVVLTSQKKGAVVFDSTALSAGDYYITTPLKPGRWSMETSKGAKGSFVVMQAEPTKMPRLSQQGAAIKTDGGVFEPRAGRFVSGDGLVFEVTGGPLVITVSCDEKAERRDGKRPVHVRYPGRSGPAPSSRAK